MPEYLSPGVYIEEVSYRAKTIEGVSTSTTGFTGPALFGPTSGIPELLTSLADFERIYGGLDQPEFDSESPSDNYLAHAVRAYFEQGGKRLYVARLYQLAVGASNGGMATATVKNPGVGADLIVNARYPGSGGDVTMTFTFRPSQNVLAGVPRDPANPTGPTDPVLRGVNEFDVLWVSAPTSPPSSPPASGKLYYAERVFDNVNKRWTWVLKRTGSADLPLANLIPGTDRVRVISASVNIAFPGVFTRSERWDNMGLDSRSVVSVTGTFAPTLTNRMQALTVPVTIDTTFDGVELGELLMNQARPASDRVRILKLLGLPTTDITTDVSVLATLDSDKLSLTDRQLVVQLAGGADGVRPEPAYYEGDDTDPKAKTGLKAFEDIQDISIVAAPGYSHGATLSPHAAASAQQVMQSLIGHAEYMRYRIAVLDSADGQALSDVRAYRAQVDTSWAALYYPWVRILDPITDNEINLPPSGFVAGIYARNDVTRGVHKAPANEVVQGAIGFETMLNNGQQDVLNPEGINCFRNFDGRGYRLWGARTVSSDPEWKYVNLRRYFAYLERSIELGTQWVVFEPNSSYLWGNVRRTVEDFLFNEWKNGHLMGDKPEQAYFVRCDLSTMTQNDLDNGRLVCQIGVSPIRPAEFVIFRIGQWTADSQQ
jgi:phage tail sheath protein FI